MTDLILTELRDRVLTIRMNRADKKNALTQAMYLSLAEALNGASSNPAVRVVVLGGAPDAFSSGNDVQDFLSSAPAKFEGSPVSKFMFALAGCPKPVIAAVNGLAIGVGITALLHCDLVYVGESARLQFPFVNIGICTEFASTYLLPRIMGNARAAELVLFGEPFKASKALEYGLVNEVLPDAQVEARAFERARKLAEQPPNALRVNKQLMRRWNDSIINEAIRLEADHFLPMLKQPEALEAMGAFLQKRKPDFSKFE